MTRHLDAPKSDPAAVAKLAIDAIKAGDAEIIADETSRRVLASPPESPTFTPGRPTRPAKHAPRAWRPADTA